MLEQDWEKAVTQRLNLFFSCTAGPHSHPVEHVPPSALHKVTFCSSGHHRLHSCQQWFLLWHCLQVRRSRSCAFSSISPLTLKLCKLYISADLQYVQSIPWIFRLMAGRQILVLLSNQHIGTDLLETHKCKILTTKFILSILKCIFSWVQFCD